MQPDTLHTHFAKSLPAVKILNHRLFAAPVDPSLPPKCHSPAHGQTKTYSSPGGVEGGGGDDTQNNINLRADLRFVQSTRQITRGRAAAQLPTCCANGLFCKWKQSRKVFFFCWRIAQLLPHADSINDWLLCLIELWSRSIDANVALMHVWHHAAAVSPSKWRFTVFLGYFFLTISCVAWH